MPASASAFCWVSAAAMVTGVMAPIRVKGVTATAWPCSDMAMRPSLIAWSKRPVTADGRAVIDLVGICHIGEIAVEMAGRDRQLDRRGRLVADEMDGIEA